MTVRGVRLRRVYEQVGADDGARVLVDGMWPRGVRKDAARLDEWIKAIAPSTELRKWYGHDPEKFARFRSHYLAELDSGDQQEGLERLRAWSRDQPVTLLTATRDVEHSHAAILAELLRE